MYLKSYYYIFLAFVLTFSSLPASAAEADNRKKTPELTIDEVIVTADKREQSVQDIPTSMTVYSGLQLEDRGVDDIKDMVLHAPNIHMKAGIAARSLNFRGISNDADYIHSPVGVFVDDISFSLNLMRAATLYDIERVEILRGPQGTLYGKNTESGVINIITKKPGNDFRGTIYTDVGAYQPEHDTIMSYKTGFSLSGPVVKDRLFIGLAGDYEKSDGYIINLYYDDKDFYKIDQSNIRLTTRWTPTHKWDITASADMLKTDNGHAGIRYEEGPYATDFHEVNNNSPKDTSEHNGDGQTLKVKYEADNFDITSISGRRFYKAQSYSDGNNSPVEDGINDISYLSDMLSQELRFTSNKEKRLKWVAGIYVYREDYDSYIGIPLYNETRDSEIESHGYAVFGQATYSLTEKLHLTAGLRYGYDKQDGTLDFEGAARDYSFSKEFDEDVLLPKFSLSYDVTPDVMTYATVAKGYYGGGYNTSFAYNADDFAYDSEYTWNYEAGLKSSLLGNRLNVNLAVFYIDIKDKQVAQLDELSHMMVVENAAEAHSQGFELEVHARPAAGLDLFAGVGYTDVVFDDWKAKVRNGMTISTQDYKDKKMPNAPEYTYNLGSQYRHSSGLFGRVDLRKIKSFYSDPGNTNKIDGYTLVNLRVGYETERFDVILWGKNIFNKEYVSMGFARRYDLATDGEPRMIGTTVRWRF